MPEDAGVSKDQQFYLGQAYINAFGNDDEAAWDPDQGFAANRTRLIQVYDYYQATYLKQPDLFLWAGLGRMAGGAVVAGLDIVMTLSPESFLTKTLVRIAKTIFHDIAWQHEAFLDDPQTAITLAGEHDTEAHPQRSYATAWMDIASGDSGRKEDRAMLSH